MWSYKEGLVIGAGLLVIGLLLQMTVGAIHWDLFACPVNVIVLVVYIIAFVNLTAFPIRFEITWNTRFLSVSIIRLSSEDS